MSESPRYDRLAAELLRRPTFDESEVISSGTFAIPVVERALAKRRARARAWRWSGRLAIAASVLAAVGAGGWLTFRRFNAPIDHASTLEGSVMLVRGREQRALREGDALAVGDRVEVSPGGSSRLLLADGTRLDLEGHLSVVAVTKHRRFQLEAGRVRLAVTRQAPGDSLTVSAGDVNVEVWGTRFEVARVPYSEACGGTVAVRVTEGAVAVRQAGMETRLGPGDTWPHCEPQAQDRDSEMGPSPGGPKKDQGLAAQNSEFRRLMTLKKASRDVEAISGLEAFAKRFPESPLLEGALVERMRLLAKQSGARGREAAKEYLKRYPRGFAADEAAELAGR